MTTIFSILLSIFTTTSLDETIGVQDYEANSNASKTVEYRPGDEIMGW